MPSESSDSKLFRDRIPLKNPYVAAALAWLLPGAGHFYQGRYFKAVLYAVCIWGTFLYGLQLAQWRGMYYQFEAGNTRYGFIAQAGIGTPAILSYVQARRYQASNSKRNDRGALQHNDFSRINEPVQSEFRATNDWLRLFEEVDSLEGEVHLNEPVGQEGFGTDYHGIFTGTMNGDTQVTVKVAGLSLDRGVGCEDWRLLKCKVMESSDPRLKAGQIIFGAVPRPVQDWLFVPVDDDMLQSLNRQLGKLFELALVYTWIAGLLNVLAVWDAFEGPAYGYGDELATDEDEKKRKEASTKAAENESSKSDAKLSTSEATS